jgi:hypothetical protein
LSYLGSVSRGWHDSLSGTYVVKKKKLAKQTLLSKHQKNLEERIKTVETKIRLFIVNCIQGVFGCELVL